jgi:HEAT repeat protein
VPAFAFQSAASDGESTDYRAGLRQLDAREWDAAIHSFSAAAKASSNADAALYWKAYAQNRAGWPEAALLTIGQLKQRYSNSRWLRDARALELEIRSRRGGQVNPTAEPDENLKLLALNSLMQSDPAAALPALQQVLAKEASDRVKEQALFVLAQSGSPDADKLLIQIANGRAHPELQVKAIRMIGLLGGDEARKSLANLYRTSSNTAVKRAILQSAMQSGSRDLLVDAAKSETNPELRADAIRQLAMTGGADQLWQLYGSTRSIEDKKAILHSMFMSGDSSRLVEIAQQDGNPELRAAAIQSLGLMGENGRPDALVALFEKDTNEHVRQAVLNALMLQQNGRALVDLARHEKDPNVKAEIVSKMARVHSPEVANYMMEILK